MKPARWRGTDPGDQGDAAREKVVDPDQANLFEQGVDPASVYVFDSDDAAEGVRRKEEALDGHEGRQHNRLELCRRYLTSLARERLVLDPLATVNSDDARAFCDAEGIERGPWMGSIFRGDDWVSVGFMPSADPVQHATTIRKWRRARG
jgi:hypothetical protein